MFFEKVFFVLDRNCSGFVLKEDIDRFLSYVALDMSYYDREELLHTGMIDIDGDGLYSRPEFLTMCVQHLWDEDVELMKIGAENFEAAQSIVDSRANAYWRDKASSIDNLFRISMVPGYLMTLIFLSEMRIDDRLENVLEVPSDSPAGSLAVNTTRIVTEANMDTPHVIKSLAMPVILLIVFVMYLKAKTMTLAMERQRNEDRAHKLKLKRGF